MRITTPTSDPVRRATLVEKVALLGLISRTLEGRTPASAAEVRVACNGPLDDEIGRLSEADVCRALNTLSGTELVDERTPGDRSPAGKGRPVYDLTVDAVALLSTLRGDEYVGALVASIDEVMHTD